MRNKIGSPVQRAPASMAPPYRRLARAATASRSGQPTLAATLGRHCRHRRHVLLGFEPEPVRAAARGAGLPAAGGSRPAQTRRPHLLPGEPARAHWSGSIVPCRHSWTVQWHGSHAATSRELEWRCSSETAYALFHTQMKLARDGPMRTEPGCLGGCDASTCCWKNRLVSRFARGCCAAVRCCCCCRACSPAGPCCCSAAGLYTCAGDARALGSGNDVMAGEEYGAGACIESEAGGSTCALGPLCNCNRRADGTAGDLHQDASRG